MLAMLQGTLFPCVRARVTFGRKNADILESRPLGRSNASKGYNGKLVYLPLAEQLAVGLLYDQGESYVHVRDVELGTWNLSIKAAMEIATANLQAISPTDFRQIEPGIKLFVATWPDVHTSARLLMPEIFTRVPDLLTGPVVAMAPSADRILVADGDDISALMLMMEISASLWQDARPIPMQPLVLKNGAWDYFQLPPDHPCYFEMKLFNLAAINLAYEQDSERIAIETKDSLFAPTLEVVQDLSTGSIYTKAIVPQGRRSSVPRADYLEFFREGQEGQYESLGVCSLARAFALLKNRIEEDYGSYPPRVLVRSFPDQRQIMNLGFEKESTLPVYVPPPEGIEPAVMEADDEYDDDDEDEDEVDTEPEVAEAPKEGLAETQAGAGEVASVMPEATAGDAAAVAAAVESATPQNEGGENTAAPQPANGDADTGVGAQS
ncbi:MAG: hypothetical protein SFV17_05745 [Candidatus Obscuribacter sp.]|nr:hypothetical protein [Candidatus Obscuribacter sp.]